MPLFRLHAVISPAADYGFTVMAETRGCPDFLQTVSGHGLSVASVATSSLAELILSWLAPPPRRGGPYRLIVIQKWPYMAGHTRRGDGHDGRKLWCELA